MTAALRSDTEAITRSLSGQTFAWKGRQYMIPLSGDHQIYNAGVVLEVLDILRGKGLDIPEEAVLKGFEKTKWPARFEVLAREPLVILDGAHNQQCAEALAQTMNDLLPGQKAVILTGILADKDHTKMTEILAPHAERFVCVTPPSPRALPAETLAESIRSRGMEVETAESLPAAIRTGLTAAADGGGVLVMMGSLYLAGEIRSLFRQVYRKWLRSRKIRARNSLTEQERIDLSAEIIEELRL